MSTVYPPYPGTPLKVGSSGSNVSLMQSYLNALNVQYPSLTHLTVDGKYGNATANTVKQFQAIKGLTIDGVIGENTWNAIVTDYNKYYPHGPDQYPGTPLKVGSTGAPVSHMQTALNICATKYTAINKLTVDGNFGSNTEKAVKLFQRQFSLSIDGIIGQQTWNKIVSVRDSVTSGNATKVSTAYPNTVLQNGSSGDSVRCEQSYLNIVNQSLGGRWNTLTIDGAYGSNTTKAVMSFQGYYSLKVDGKTGSATWSTVITKTNAVL